MKDMHKQSRSQATPNLSSLHRGEAGSSDKSSFASHYACTCSYVKTEKKIDCVLFTTSCV